MMLEGRLNGVPWYLIVALICAVIAPFDALYVYIKAQRRRDDNRRREKQKETEEQKRTPPL